MDGKNRHRLIELVKNLKKTLQLFRKSTSLIVNAVLTEIKKKTMATRRRKARCRQRLDFLPVSALAMWLDVGNN